MVTEKGAPRQEAAGVREEGGKEEANKGAENSLCQKEGYLVEPDCSVREIISGQNKPPDHCSDLRAGLYELPPVYRLPRLPARRQERLHILQIEGLETGKPDLMQILP